MGSARVIECYNNLSQISLFVSSTSCIWSENGGWRHHTQSWLRNGLFIVWREMGRKWQSLGSEVPHWFHKSCLFPFCHRLFPEVSLDLLYHRVNYVWWSSDFKLCQWNLQGVTPFIMLRRNATSVALGTEGCQDR